jgi:hypothetical protein
MSVQNPAFKISRWSVEGMEGMWVKMFDPPTVSPDTPELVAATNPVPEVMATAGFQLAPSLLHTVQRDLMHDQLIPTWDGQKVLVFFVIADVENFAAAVGTFPGPTIRIPRGAVFHCVTSGHGPPPHTIHWHGIEPTPMNDGVGHCSMEIGSYNYQFQPNFIGTYFYHCHRNTMQHFEFGLYGMLLIDPPDAFFATQVNPAIPIGHCRDGKRRTAANLTGFPQFPGFNSKELSDSDPWNGDNRLKFPTDPHAMTVAYDVEALWVMDDRDSVWSDLGSNARATYPRHGSVPGVDDAFSQNPGKNGFFAFNDFNADYWFVTGVPVPAHKGGTAAIPTNVEIPAALNSGVSGTQVPINAETGQTVLLRCLNGAYNSIEVTFPVNVVIIAWDGRALGVAPYGHNHAYLVPAGTPVKMSTARRFDALIRSATPVESFATVKFINTRGQVPGSSEEVLVTARIPINIGGTPQEAPSFGFSGRIIDQGGSPMEGVSVMVTPKSLGGSEPQTVLTDANGNYSVAGLVNSSYEIIPTLAGFVFTPLSSIVTINDQNPPNQNFTSSMAVGTVTLSANKPSPQPIGIPGGVTFTAGVQGGTGPFEFEFELSDGAVSVKKQAFSANASWTWNTATAAAGSYIVKVKVRQTGSTLALAEKISLLNYGIFAGNATYTPNSYTIDEALDALRIAVGAKNPTTANLARYDLAPLLNGIVQPDGKVDLQDVIAILRLVVGLPL